MSAPYLTPACPDEARSLVATYFAGFAAGYRCGQDHQFWDKIEFTDGCCLWRGFVLEHPRNQGYGRIGHWIAHRRMWTLINGPIPPGLEVLHSCDNSLCVRPDHLSLGTHAENMADMKAKGRARSVRGSAHYHARLTEEQVAEIRRRSSQRRSRCSRSDPNNHLSLAREFGVSTSTISRIVRGESWPGPYLL